jgi:hypothetical protein
MVAELACVIGKFTVSIIFRFSGFAKDESVVFSITMYKNKFITTVKQNIVAKNKKT